MENLNENGPVQNAQVVYVEKTPVTPKFKWNWFAFIQPIIFAFGTKAWLCLLYLIPFLNVVWCFVSGACAERWAWESGFYDDEKSFRKVMQTWNRAGVFVFVTTLIVLVLTIGICAALITAGLMRVNFHIDGLN